MVLERRKNKIAIVTAVFVLLLPKMVYADKSIFDGIHKTTKLQQEIIRSCKESDLSFNFDDNLQMPFLCIRAFVASIKSQNAVLPTVIVFNVPYRQLTANIPDAWSSEYMKARLNEACLPGCEFEPMYECADIDKLLSEGKLLLLYACNFHGLELEVKLVALSKETAQNKLHRIDVKYNFQLAFVENACNKKDFKKALKEFIWDTQFLAYYLIEEDGRLSNYRSNDIGWALTSIEYSKPVILDYLPECGVKDILQ